METKSVTWTTDPGVPGLTDNPVATMLRENWAGIGFDAQLRCGARLRRAAIARGFEVEVGYCDNGHLRLTIEGDPSVFFAQPWFRNVVQGVIRSGTENQQQATPTVVSAVQALMAPVHPSWRR